MAIRVLSYNILEGGEDRLAHIEHTIQQQRPDVVALMEANSRTNAEILAARLDMGLIYGEGNSEYNVAWLSRLPVMRTENYRLAIFSKTMLKIEVPWQGATLALCATHLAAGRTAEDEGRRVAEMQAMLGILKTFGEQPHALLGDLNSLAAEDQANIERYLATAAEEGEESMRAEQFPRQVIPLILQAGYIDCYRALHPTEPGYTYKLPEPSLRLDYIFASPTLAVHLQSCAIVSAGEAAIASDHLPIGAEFS